MEPISIENNSMARRDFLKTMGTAGLLVSLSPTVPSADAKALQNNPKRNIHIFSKHLQWLDYRGMAQAAADAGFDGVELTVRPRGHVLPENAERDLPKAVEETKKAGLDVRCMVVGFNSATDPHADTVLKTAGRLGIRYYRMGPVPYNASAPMDENLKSITRQWTALAELSQKHGLRGLYENHAGANFGAPVLDLWLVLKEIQTDWLGCQYDIQHAMVEGANAWPIGLRALRPYIGWVIAKDYFWAKRDGRWTVQNCPIGEGTVDFKAFFNLLGEAHQTTPVSQHFEYNLGLPRGGGAVPAAERDRIVGLMKKDLDTLRTLV